MIKESSTVGYFDRQRLIMQNNDLTSSQKLVLIVLNFHLGNCKRCWPSIETIAKESSASRSTVKRALRDLRSAGIIEIDSGGGCRSSSYSINPHTLTGGMVNLVDSEPGSDRTENRSTVTPPGSTVTHKQSMNKERTEQSGFDLSKMQVKQPEATELPSPEQCFDKVMRLIQLHNYQHETNRMNGILPPALLAAVRSVGGYKRFATVKDDYPRNQLKREFIAVLKKSQTR